MSNPHKAKVTESGPVLFLGAVVAAFVAGVTAYIFVITQIETRVQQAVAELKLKNELPIGPQGPAGPQGPESSGAPVGSVFAFWGNVDRIPVGYELCNGELVTTSNSPLLGQRKPDLRDTFVKGAGADSKDVLANPESGGHNFQSLNHKHEAGDLRALIGTADNSYYIIFKERGKAFGGTRQVSGGDYRSPGGNSSYGTEVDGTTGGTTDKGFGNFDMRPKFVSMFFIIKVK